MNIQFIGVSEVADYLKNDSVQFIDLRDAADYRRKHIRGAVSMPYDTFLQSYSALSRKKMYVLYCDRGATSVTAAAKMQSSGYKVYSLAGGINAFNK